MDENQLYRANIEVKDVPINLIRIAINPHIGAGLSPTIENAFLGLVIVKSQIPRNSFTFFLQNKCI
jgi:hypothetical protein